MHESMLECVWHSAEIHPLKSVSIPLPSMLLAGMPAGHWVNRISLHAAHPVRSEMGWFTAPGPDDPHGEDESSSLLTHQC